MQYCNQAIHVYTPIFGQVVTGNVCNAALGHKTAPGRLSASMKGVPHLAAVSAAAASSSY